MGLGSGGRCSQQRGQALQGPGGDRLREEGPQGCQNWQVTDGMSGRKEIRARQVIQKTPSPLSSWKTLDKALKPEDDGFLFLK